MPNSDEVRVDVPAQCPRCRANNNAEAETMCQPGCDDCPMCFQDEWPTAQQMKDRYDWTPPEAAKP